MGAFVDLTGKQFGRWTVIGRDLASKWSCACRCGTIKSVAGQSLTTGASSGCMKCRPKKHGKCYTYEYRMMIQARHRAKVAGLPFTITLGDIVVPELCPILGIPLQFSHSRFSASNPSLDRIIPSIGYVPGNVWVISWRANVIKHDASLDELERLTAALRSKIAERGLSLSVFPARLLPPIEATAR